MSIYALNATHVLNKFIWQMLKNNLGWNVSNYGGLIPITASGQEPEFNQINAPYIVYNYTTQGTPDTMLKQEQIAYTIYSSNESDIRSFINLMDDILNREDDSAKDVNSYVDALDINSPHHNFDFKWIRMMSGSSAQPPLQEGGRMDGIVVMRLCYAISSDGSRLRDGAAFGSIPERTAIDSGVIRGTALSSKVIL